MSTKIGLIAGGIGFAVAMLTVFGLLWFSFSDGLAGAQGAFLWSFIFVVLLVAAWLWALWRAWTKERRRRYGDPDD